MKLEKFKEKNNKRKFTVIFTVCCILLLTVVFLYTSFAVFTEEKQFNVINGTYQDPGDLYYAIYVDDKISNTIPSKDSGYTLDTEKSSCNNGVTVSWDDESWSTLVNFTNYQAENMSRTKCTLYFKEVNIYKDCVSEYGENSPNCQIISSLDTTGACPTVGEDGTMSVTKSESLRGYSCSAPDDYGTSYYYRGSVNNNYVQFAGYYWRIVRVNGDDSIRIIYSGTSEGSTGTNTQIGTSAYNSNNNDNAYVGYMYGATGASTYEETHTNTNNSTIKGVIDTWYEENIANHPEYTEYISDTLFCNDRSFASNNTGTGAGNSISYYRIYSDNKTLKCTNQNDRFTVNDTNLGNGALTYPIALLTGDELALAGNFRAANYGFYLYTGATYWTMTPVYFSGTNARNSFENMNGVSGEYSVDADYGIRPVLNLKPGSLTQGSGTALDPYQLSGN